ncbi:MAG: D-glycero-beta-D-manno-heptose 1,7-bisphosphate 7-phosphatase [Burkholderiaceae bacterium]|nr:D-glycero-beta-D-manno-heptose 1,7-bisphosphate 7-phosphatase [Burkholderiaceae bacterium]
MTAQTNLNSTPAVPAVFCDRDGVINVDHGYVHRWEDFHIYPGVPEALAHLRQAGWVLVLVTNQSGIARGYYDEQAFHLLTQQMQAFLEKQNAQFDAVYFCPHLPDATVPELAQNCRCRKPGPGMFEQAASQFDINLSQSVCVGDKAIDIQAARSAGVGQAYGVGAAERFEGCAPDARFDEPAAALEAALTLR